MKKLPLRDRVFWKNLFQFFITYIGASLLFSVSTDPEESFNLMQGFGLTSFFCVLILGFKIALEFADQEDENQKRINREK